MMATTPGLDSISGKLKSICPTLYSSLSSLELELIDNCIGDQVSEQEVYFGLPGLTESETGENTLGVVLDSLLPSYKEVLTPTPLPTYRGPTLHNSPATDLGLGPAETTSTSLGKDYTWSRGHGFEHSPIKTRSARRKEGHPPIHSVVSSNTSTDIGALRGMKALAREKP
jgi:hypothetical protein